MTKPPLTMVDNVVVLQLDTTLPVPVERVLAGAANALLASVIVIGYKPDGSFYFVSSDSSRISALWDLEWAKAKLIAMSLDGQ